METSPSVQSVGCGCKRSVCQSGYCPCHKSATYCSLACRCTNCANKASKNYKSHFRDQEVSGPLNQEVTTINQRQGQNQEEIHPRKTIKVQNLEVRKPFRVKDNANDPLKRGEEMAQSMRKLAKESKIRSKRLQAVQQKHPNNSGPPAASTMIRVLLQNVRGLTSNLKQFSVKGLIQQTKPDIVGLTETRLKKAFKIQQTHSIQSKYDQKGGIWCATTTSRQVKNIKYIGNSITYQSVAYHSCPLHIITCYLSPVIEDATAVRMSIQHLKAIIQNIFSTFRNSKVIVMGDFNQKWTPEITETMKWHSLLPVLPPGVSTHHKGGQLDNIFTSIPVIIYSVQQFSFSDHLTVIANLRFTKSHEDLDLRFIPVKHTQKSIRQAATSEITKKLLKDNPSCLQEPLRDLITPQLPQKGRISHWYKKPPKWFLIQEPDGGKDLQGERALEWKKLMNEIERAHEANQSQRFHKLVQQACHLKNTGNPIKGITIQGEQILDESIIEDEVVKYYSQLCTEQSSAYSEMKDNQASHIQLFSSEDVERAIQRCNYEKGIGPDAFDGKLLDDKGIRDSVSTFISSILNTGQIPDYLLEGRLVLLSKGQRGRVVPIEETMPIVINSHIYKICERTIEDKLEAAGSQLLTVGPYQCGFKKHNSMHSNITKLLKSILQDNRKKKSKNAFLLVDLKKAYESVKHTLLFDILKQKASTEEEKKIVELMRVLGSENKIHYGSSTFSEEGSRPRWRSVVQAIQCVPQTALKSNHTFASLIQNNRLFAFADNILIRVNGKEQMKALIEALNSLVEVFGLKLNFNKTVFLSNSPDFKGVEKFEGIMRVTSSKYLGITASQCRQARGKFSTSPR